MANTEIAGVQDWPFAPGKGPFRIKGGSYRGHQAFVDGRVPGGFAAMLERAEPNLREFYRQPFLASSWYDLAPLVAMAPICSAALGISPDDYVRARSLYQVEHDITGIYGFVVKLISPKTIASRLPGLVGLYFDFIETEIQTVESGRVVTVQHGLPRPLAAWVTTVAAAYLGGVLERTKVAHTLTISPPIPEGEAHGVPLVGFTLTVEFG